ncbi:fimbrial protein [Xanthomonas sp. 60]
MNLLQRLASLLVMGLLLPGAAWAQNCVYRQGQGPLVNVANLNGSITVGPDVPVGTEIYNTTYYAGPTNEVACTKGDMSRSRRYVTLPFPKSAYVSPRFGNNVYDTNVPGIGVVVWFSGTPFPSSVSDEFNGDYVNVFLPNQSYDLSLIKTGPIAAGTLTGASLPTFEYRMDGVNSGVVLWSGRVQGSLNIVSRTCTTQDVTVDLGIHQLSEIPTVGSTTAWVDVPVVLSNCPAFFGKWRRWVTTGTTQTETGRTSNQIRYRVDPVTRVTDAGQSVMALQDDGVTATATGVGIQIGTANEDSVGFGAARDSGLALSETNNASYTIALRARYMRQAAQAAAGQANGAATITLEYN